ncbi:glycosyltransferase [Stutzerimonas stutzeri]|uniref:glycosyltransferase n=1 Tax=Stutzerimonas stutzeri TaxID=316 RepID=UPI00210B6AC5|nr:glycosyltransferase [Stutzerimonas stutzeri]MCQ4321761.1 glycosyltransferase [Stutzerimonas stutzeri]
MSTLPTPYTSQAILPWEHALKVEMACEILPTVSIVIPIYNSGRFLEKTLRSLLCNDLNGVELLLMDGGSTDDTMQIVDHYKPMFAHVFSGKDKGQSDAINNGYAKASGDILYWLNGDDIILPNTLNQVRRYFKKHKCCQVLVGNAYMTEIDLTSINHFVFSPEKLTFEHLLDYAKHHLIQPSVFFTRKAWETAGPLDIHDHYAMDADLFIGMAKVFTLHHIDIDIAYSVYHEECKTRGARGESITSLALVQAKHGGFKECRETLNILVSLYKELEAELQSSSPSNARLKALEAKLTALTAHQERQKELALQSDLEMHP